MSGRSAGDRGRDDPIDLLLLQELPRVGPVMVRHLVERFGSARGALLARGEDFADVAGAAAARARSDGALRGALEEALRRARQLDVRVVTWDDPDYPARLRQLTDPPPVLFLRGRADLAGRPPLVTVVGARRATARGRDVAERLGAALARAGVTVVSGLALGIDGAAHHGALRVGGDSVAVLGTGPDRAYPVAHRRLFRALIGRGLLVSEFIPGAVAAPHHFPRRNRILAALSSVVVVVEAGARSGALITVDHALDLGRDVWAVPGPIDSPTCAGSNRLLYDGARALVSIEDFVEIVAPTAATTPAPPAATPSAPAGAARPRPAAPSGPAGLEARALGALGEGALLVDELAARLDVPASTALALLTTLELHGEVERLPGMRFRRAA